MASRNFCDWCESEIKPKEPYYTAQGTSKAVEDHYDESIYVGDLNRSATFYNDMICRNCYTKVLALIEDLKQGL